MLAPMRLWLPPRGTQLLEKSQQAVEQISDVGAIDKLAERRPHHKRRGKYKECHTTDQQLFGTRSIMRQFH